MLDEFNWRGKPDFFGGIFLSASGASSLSDLDFD
jgi:hypothetical protein